MDMFLKAVVEIVQAVWPLALLLIVTLFLFMIIDRADAKGRKDGDK